MTPILNPNIDPNIDPNIESNIEHNIEPNIESNIEPNIVHFWSKFRTFFRNKKIKEIKLKLVLVCEKQVQINASFTKFLPEAP